MVIKTGIETEKLSKSISLIGLIMNKPTTISAGAVAAEGISRKIGARSKEIKKKTAMTRAVRPVLPPAATRLRFQHRK